MYTCTYTHEHVDGAVNEMSAPKEQNSVRVIPW